MIIIIEAGMMNSGHPGSNHCNTRPWRLLYSNALRFRQGASVIRRFPIRLVQGIQQSL